MGLRFSEQSNTSHYLSVLLAAAAANPGKFDVYTHETMPERYHFANNERIAPVYVVPRIGYALTNRNEGDVGMTKGVRSPFRPFHLNIDWLIERWRSESWIRQ